MKYKDTILNVTPLFESPTKPTPPTNQSKSHITPKTRKTNQLDWSFYELCRPP